MKTDVSKVLFILILALSLNSCTKDDQDSFDDMIQSKNIYELAVVTHPSYNVDSIFYENDKILKYRMYKMDEGGLCFDRQYRFDYENDGLKIYTQKAGCIENLNTFYYEDSKISHINDENGKVRARFFYEGDKLVYFLYYESPYNEAVCYSLECAVTDSISVKYDTEGVNIAEFSWYGRRNTDYPFYFKFKHEYSFDKMKNPFNNSTYYLAHNWDRFDDLVRYFNTNNIVGLGTHSITYNYNEGQYPVSSFNNTLGTTYFYYNSK
jgi:hypothetical protein